MIFSGFTILYDGNVPDFNNILNIENCFRLFTYSYLLTYILATASNVKKPFKNTKKIE